MRPFFCVILLGNYISKVFKTVPIKRTDQYSFTFSIVSIAMSPEDPDNISDNVC